MYEVSCLFKLESSEMDHSVRMALINSSLSVRLLYSKSWVCTRPGHTKDNHKNGTQCVKVGVWKCSPTI